MKRPLIILTTSYPRFSEDEAGIFIFRLVRALSNAGARGAVIVPKDLERETLEESGNFSVLRASYGLFRSGSLAFGAGIVPNIRKDPSRMLQIPSLLFSMARSALRVTESESVISAQWIFCGVAAWLVSLRSGVPYTITIRGEDFRLLKILPLRVLLLPTLRRASAIITVSRAFEAELKKMPGVPKDRIHLVENGVDAFAEGGDVAPLSLPAEKYLLFAGTVIPRKRVDLLLELIKQSSLRAYSLVICGRLDDQIEHQRLLRRAADLKLIGRVFFQGAVSPFRMAQLMVHARAYVSTSAFEGRPNAVLEALAAGTVVALSRIAAHEELVNDDQNGLLFDTADIPSAARRLGAVLENPQRRAEIAAQARQSVSSLSWERAAEKYLNLLNRA